MDLQHQFRLTVAQVPQNMWLAAATGKLVNSAQSWCTTWLGRPQAVNTFATFSAAFTAQFAQADHAYTSAKELSHIAMTGTAHKYTRAWEKGLSKAPETLCAKHPMLHHAILHNVKPHLMRMINVSQCTTIQTCFREIELAEAKTSAQTTLVPRAPAGQGFGAWGTRQATSSSSGATAKKPRSSSNVRLAAARSSDESSPGKARGC